MYILDVSCSRARVEACWRSDGDVTRDELWKARVKFVHDDPAPGLLIVHTAKRTTTGKNRNTSKLMCYRRGAGRCERCGRRIIKIKGTSLSN